MQGLGSFSQFIKESKKDCNNVNNIQDINAQYSYEDKFGRGLLDGSLVSCGQDGSNGYNELLYLNGLGGIEIGNNVSISAHVIIVSTGLDTNCFLNRKEHVNKRIKIGDNVQIGAGAIILAGVEIGNDVIVGAGSIVTKSIRSNCIVVGNPAETLKSLLQ